MHVRLHQFCNYINVFKTRSSRRFRNVKYLNDIFMIKEFKELDLPNYSFCVNQVFKGFRDLFNRYLDLCLIIVGTTNDSVGSVTNLFDVLKLILNQKSCS